MMSVLNRLFRRSVARSEVNLGKLLHQKEPFVRASVKCINKGQTFVRWASLLHAQLQEVAALNSNNIRNRPPYRFPEIVNKSCRYFATEISADDCLVEELKEKLENKSVYLVDVRRPDELKESGYIFGAVNIPLDELESALQLTDDAFEHQFKRPKPSEDGTNLVFHCRSGVRSLTALGIARGLGYERSRHVPGGFLLWNEKFGH